MKKLFIKVALFGMYFLFLFSCQSNTIFESYNSRKKQKVMLVRWRFNLHTYSHPRTYKTYFEVFQIKNWQALSKSEKKEQNYKINSNKISKNKVNVRNIIQHVPIPALDSVKIPKYNYSSRPIGYETGSIFEMNEVDSILRSGTVTKLKGEWYKKVFHPVSELCYQEMSKNSFKQWYSDTFTVKKRSYFLEHWYFKNNDLKRDYLFYMMQPRYIFIFGKQKGTRIIAKKIIFLGYQHIINDPQRGMSFSDIDADFEYYYDGKDFYLLSNIAFHALDKYLKHKMGIKSILEEKLEEEKEEKKKKNTDE